MFGKNSKFGFLMFGKRRNLEVQCLEKVQPQNSNVWKEPKFRIPMFGKGKFWNSSNWKKPKFLIQMCGNTKMQNTDVWKLLKFTIPMFRKSQNLEFQSLERAKMWNSNL